MHGHSMESLAVRLLMNNFLKARLRLGILAYFHPCIMHRRLHVAYPSIPDLVLWDTDICGAS